MKTFLKRTVIGTPVLLAAAAIGADVTTQPAPPTSQPGTQPATATASAPASQPATQPLPPRGGGIGGRRG